MQSSSAISDLVIIALMLIIWALSLIYADHLTGIPQRVQSQISQSPP